MQERQGRRGFFEVKKVVAKWLVDNLNTEKSVQVSEVRMWCSLLGKAAWRGGNANQLEQTFGMG